MQRPEISILMPLYNAAGTLAVALKSILRQSWVDWECVVVDDGSADGSLDMVRGHAARDPRIRVLACAHRGIVPTLNEASPPMIGAGCS